MKKGFTLVELLAVIVILAVILVIAVPQITKITKQTRINTVSSTAKLIASKAEEKEVENQATERNEEINCNTLVVLDENYRNCTVSKIDGKWTVKIRGAGKFEGIKCVGTKDNMNCMEIAEIACPTGMTSDDDDVTDLSQCKITCSAGTYLAAGGTSCSTCPAGSYCVGGTYNYSEDNNSGITVCSAGSYSESGSSSCTICENGMTSSVGSSSCSVACSNNSNVSEWNTPVWNGNEVDGLCSIKTCETSYKIENNQCVLDVITCSAGTYLAANGTSCSTCPAGSYCVGGTYAFGNSVDQGKATCSAGTYSGSGASSCTACGAGRYSGAGASGCSSISAGCYGTSATTACPSQCSGRTQYSTGGASSCSTVSSGYYTTGCTGSNKCTGQSRCTAGNYCSNGVSYACSANYTSGAGATSCTPVTCTVYCTSSSNCTKNEPLSGHNVYGVFTCSAGRTGAMQQCKYYHNDAPGTQKSFTCDGGTNHVAWSWLCTSGQLVHCENWGGLKAVCNSTAPHCGYHQGISLSTSGGYSCSC